MTNVLNIVSILLLHLILAETNHYSDADSHYSDVQYSSTAATSYLLYDVNPHEGFNLRRDVFIRIAVFIKQQYEHRSLKWRLVLPPWNHLPHWRSEQAGNQNQLPWGLFFDLMSLQNYIPVIEAYEFFEDHPNTLLDHVIILQNFKDLWAENFTWEDKFAIEPCRRSVSYTRDETGVYKGSALGFQNIHAKNVSCLSYQGPTALFATFLEAYDSGNEFLLVEHAEIMLHDHYGSGEYWKCRKSMKFSDELMMQAFEFRESTVVNTSEIKTENATTYFEGDPYLCVHLRRQDYVRSRPVQVPSIKHAAHQIKRKLAELNLSTVFVATDANEEEFDELSHLLLPLRTVRYQPSLAVLKKYKDGGVAIIEQIVCSYAKYFIGSYESTFSFRVQEERELLDMDPDMTFNRLCGDNENDCIQPTRWLKV